jgi:pimeloyl-ACP methyl ester carboxylesterase
MPVLGRLTEYLTSRSLVESTLRSVYGDPGKVTPLLVDRYFELALREGNRHALVGRLRQMTPGADVERLKALRVPTLILWGGRDRLIPIAAAKRFEADIAGSQLVVFDTLGHMPQEEDPQATVQVVRQILGI